MLAKNVKCNIQKYLHYAPLKHFYCRQIFNLGPNVIFNTQIQKMFRLHNGSLH